MRSLIISSIILFLGLAALGQNEKDHYRNQLSKVNENISQTPGDISLYLEKANLYNDMNDFANANQTYNKAINMYHANTDPQYKETYAAACYRLADDHFFRNSEEEKALHYITSGLEIVPESKTLQIMEAIVMSANEAQQEAAMHKFEALSQKYPGDVRLLTYYAQFLEDIDPMKAAAQYEKIINIEPVNYDALLTLGIIYNNEASRLAGTGGDPAEVYSLAEQSVDFLEKAHRLDPEDEELAHILELVGAELDEQPREDSKKKTVPF